MKTRFHIFFGIEAGHRYFTGGRWNETRFVPLPETEKRLRGQGFTFRQIGNELLVGAPVDGNGKIRARPETFEAFSFLLLPQSANYLNFSNLPVGNNGCLHFHNLNANTLAGKAYLSRPVAAYTPVRAYVPGEFATGADGHTYECIQKNPSGAGNTEPDDAEADSKAFWIKHGKVAFASAGDGFAEYDGELYPLQQTGYTCEFKVAAARKTHHIRFYGINPANGNYDREVLTETATFDKPYDRIRLNLDGLPSGKYRVDAENECLFVYLNPLRAGNPAFLIDIFNLPSNFPQALLKANNSLNSPRFKIDFAARRVFWRYKTRTALIDLIEDGDGQFDFKPDGARAFVSEKPIPFSQVPRKNLLAKSGGIKISTHLPNPLPDRLLPAQNDIYAAESFINF